MGKTGRNDPCPCGSGEKYKSCCEPKERIFRKTELPPGRFRYVSGSYGSQDRGFMSSILCYKQVGEDPWKEHFCLVKPDVLFSDEEEAAKIAEQYIASASELKENSGSIQDFALSLKHKGYKNVTDFQVVRGNSKLND